jgi:hypothetical protein
MVSGLLLLKLLIDIISTLIETALLRVHCRRAVVTLTRLVRGRYMQQRHIIRIQFSILPNEIRVPWEERVRVLEESRQQAKKQFSKIWEDWDKAGLEEQSATERAWTEQLEDKTLWDAAGEGVGENKLWRDFLAWARGDI